MVEALLHWFASRSRNVPWRGERDPYRIWVSEVMSQQTRLKTVRERAPGFFAEYPSIEALAESTLDDLLKAWEGLGYYSRARSLRRAAILLRDRARATGQAAALPTTAAELRDLPGIGPYTAGAVASMAFGRAEPAIDGNARRVLSRLFDVERPVPRVLDEKARSLIDAADDRATGAGAGDRGPGRSLASRVNQAIMDLGGTVCTPRDPDCDACPVSTHCLALARGTVALRPPPRSRAPRPHVDVAVAIVRRGDGRLFVQRRPEEGLLGGLWEFPGGKIEPGETARAAAVRETREETGLEIRITGAAGAVDHAYSHFTVSLHAFHAALADDGADGADGADGNVRGRCAGPVAWIEAGELAGLAMPTANRRLLEQAGLGSYQPK